MLLLDTQVALWWLTASPRRPRASRELMAAPCALSVASIWDVALKHRLGKLPDSPRRRFRDEMQSSGRVIVSVRDEHVLTMTDVATSTPIPSAACCLA